MHYTLCDFILDVIQNSLEAGAASVRTEIRQNDGDLTVRIADDGKGMSHEELEKALDPFHTDGVKHRARKVGLGLPFLRHALEQTGRKLDIRSGKGSGTTVSFSFPLEHIDTPPQGDITGVMVQALTFDGEYEMEIFRSAGSGQNLRSYTVRRSELIDALGDLNESGSLMLLRKFLESQEAEVYGEADEESGD